jgi:uncharacterized protein (TIGR00730 family)
MINRQENKIKSIGVFCGSGAGKRKTYSEKAASMGRLLAQRNISMIYGGGNIGLMGTISDSMLEAGGKVHGVITEHLYNVELAHQNIDVLDIVQTMSERKERMIGYSDAFIIMPGGYGTFDELLEVLTLCQLNHIQKAIGLFNVEGFFDPFAALIRHSVAEGFIRPEHGEMFFLEGNEERLLERLEQYKPVETSKWLTNFKKEKY